MSERDSPRIAPGSTTIAGVVVARIAAVAAREVAGVAGMGGGVSAAMGQVVGRLRGIDHSTAGVSVEVGKIQTAIDLSVRLFYPVAIHDLTERIRRHVVERVTTLTGLEVVEVNIDVVDLIPHDPATAPQTAAASTR